MDTQPSSESSSSSSAGACDRKYAKPGVSTTTYHGYLIKEGGSWKSWKKRYFVLSNGVLVYSKSDRDAKSKGVIPLENAGHIRAVEYGKKKNVFQIQTPARTYHISAESSDAREKWVEVLNQALVELHPPPKPTKVGVQDFELIKLVGKGSFGKVMQVRYKATGEIFAMKMLSKQHILEHGEVEHTMAERNILQKLHHPFLMNLHYSFQTDDKLYLILDFVNGGELFYHLQREHRFSIERVRFYAAEICLALEHLHNAGVIYRDLKPENILLTNEGHICLTDFGLSKEGILRKEDKTDTFCGTPEYLAPEILLGNGYGKAVDWWSYGSLLYEMLTGLPPFYSQDVQDMYKRIVADALSFPDYVPEDARALLARLLVKEPDARLSDPNQIKGMRFFDGIDWEKLFRKEIVPPYVPPVKGAADVSQIDVAFTSEPPSHNIAMDESDPMPLLTEEQQEFSGFTYTADDC